MTEAEILLTAATPTAALRCAASWAMEHGMAEWGRILVHLLEHPEWGAHADSMWRLMLSASGELTLAADGDQWPYAPVTPKRVESADERRISAAEALREYAPQLECWVLQTDWYGGPVLVLAVSRPGVDRCRAHQDRRLVERPDELTVLVISKTSGDIPA